MTKFKTQVEESFYIKEYDSLTRFASYYHQIKKVVKLSPETLLEIGVGNKTVSNYLKEMGIKVKTCDFDSSLKPDIIADIRKIPLDNKSFDLVMACEVLEHLPFEELDNALNELNRISKEYVIISIPYASLCFEFIFKFPFADKFFGNHFINFLIRIPLWIKNKFNGEHYWEMGKQGYSKRLLRKKISNNFEIIEESTPALSSYHYFFILKKKKR